MKKIIVANWKMNPASLIEAKRLFALTAKKARKIKNAEVVVTPPFPYLGFFQGNGAAKLGAQDVFWKDPTGAFTGEVSPKILKDFGVCYVLIGHSERRALGETDEIIRQKLKAAVSGGLKVVLCVGEKERSQDSFPILVRDELQAALKGLPRRFAPKLLVAHEPVWAISTTKGAKPDTPENFFEMSIFIRRTILDIWGRKIALRIPVLYGGSVNSKNAEEFLKVKGTGGLLVGGASLNSKEFGKILDVAKQS